MMIKKKRFLIVELKGKITGSVEIVLSSQSPLILQFPISLILPFLLPVPFLFFSLSSRSPSHPSHHSGHPPYLGSLCVPRHCRGAGSE